MDDDPVIPVFIPALVVVLDMLEARKGSPLSEDEVLSARDNAVCMTMRRSHAVALAEKRGGRDIDPENVWAEWRALRESNAG